MLNPKRLSAALFLICALGLSAWADCLDPGQMGTPPCTSGQMLLDDSTPNDASAPVSIQGQPATLADSSSVELPSLVEIALNVLTLY